MTRETVLDVYGLSVGYLRDDRSINHVVDDVSFRLKRGSILGLVGESGCGKSTTALAAIGYRLPGMRVLAGQSSLDGVDLLTLPPGQLRTIWGSKVAYVAQSAALALNPALTVGRQLAQPLAAHLGLDRAAPRVLAASSCSTRWDCRIRPARSTATRFSSAAASSSASRWRSRSPAIRTC